jgi:2-polyprenyl-3-methyl-5-hydroxy-6-metoxy-1,4-benzoquinol methylase
MSYPQDIQHQNDRSWQTALSAGKEQFGNLEVNLRFLAQSSRIAPGLSVLEVGCGIGTIVDWLNRRGCRAVGTDISPTAVAYGRQKYPGISLAVETAEQLNSADAQFDLVLSFDVFEHLFEIDRHLSEVWRVLKPGGCYLMQTPNKCFNAAFETIRSRSLNWRCYHPSLHSPGQLRKRLEMHQFQPRFVKMDPVTPFFLNKLPRIAAWIAQHIPFTALPLCMQTNLYVIAQKHVSSLAAETARR